MKISGKAIITTIAVVVVGLAIWGWLAMAGSNSVSVPWAGTDDIVTQIASDAGRQAHPPLINTDQGNLLLFIFTLGGAVGGFLVGYFWRKLISEKSSSAGGLRKGRLDDGQRK